MTARVVSRPALRDVHEALASVATFASASPVIRSGRGGNEFWLKIETLQPTGSFKIRGAAAALAALSPRAPVVTCSAGNHGLAAAHVCEQLHLRACVVVSESAAPRKVALLRTTSAELCVKGSTYDEAEAYARRLARERDAYFLSPYNDPHVIAGQGSIGLELLGRFEGPFTVVCPVGGGGLASGLGITLASRPGCRLVGVEVERSAPMRQALAAGRVVPIDVGPTLADGLAGNLEPGSITVDLLRDHVDSMLTVTETEVTDAMHHLAASHGIIAEGAGAVGVAAVLSNRVRVPSDQPVVAVVTGCNIDLRSWAAVVQGHAPHASHEQHGGAGRART